ncbi:MAG: alanine--tRNA ligase [Candidatus Aenigmatarchaeota archaeon]|nr:alanine--tRNA ligase [Nanoarchaeota archaeon]
MDKSVIIKKFQKDPKKYWEVELFREKGFVRRQCETCKKYFWTLNSDRKTCADSTCEPYGFIGKTITAGKWNYVETWKMFEKFFVRNGHESIKRYPVIDRIRPDLYFTIASIQNFQRIDNGNMSFVYPANPLIVPQVCLRFNDIASVGVSGRHLTSFVMPGQHAFNYPKEGYFKDRCMELNFNFLVGVMGIPQNELIYAEDMWSMPGAFGPSIETFSKGLELVNHVFMQFQPSNSTFKELPIKVIDTGWGLNRLVWFSNGTNTMYESTFGPMIDRMKKSCGIELKPGLFSKYSELAGALDISEINDPEKAKKKIADALGISLKEMNDRINPMTAVYAIADHIRTLLFAITDGGIPSNIGGGYNLRVILRRALSFIDEYKLNIDLYNVAEEHAKFLKPIFPELTESLENVKKILEIEKQKYDSTIENGKNIIAKLLQKKQEITEKKFIELYESHGISPEIISKEADVPIPGSLYSKLTAGHESIKEKKSKIDIGVMEPTEILFYKQPDKKEFTAKILKVIDKKHVILDKTLFYARSGGQDCDQGTLNGKKVYNVEKIGNVFVHDVEKPNFKAGEIVSGKIDWHRRKQLMQHHTAIHLLNGVTKKILGSHVWQAGAEKTVEKAHLDITHYKPLAQEELDKIEEEANNIIKKKIPTTSAWLPRGEAEGKHGLALYQGGVVPGNEIRVLEIPGTDVEACGGIHVHNTGDIEQMIIIGSERIQDGINRITIKAGAAADAYLDHTFAIANNIVEIIKKLEIIKFSEKFSKKLTREIAFKELQKCARLFSVSVDKLEKTITKFYVDILEQRNNLDLMNKQVGVSSKTLEKRKADTLEDACNYLFELWKEQRKETENLTKEVSGKVAEKLEEKIKDKQIVEMIQGDRKELISTADSLIKGHPDITIVLANHIGDIICRTDTKDASQVLEIITKQAGGTGGGRKHFAQGKIEVSKLLKIIENIRV